MSNPAPDLLPKHSPASIVKFLANVLENSIITISILAVLLEVLEAAEVFIVRITVSSSGKGAFSPDPSHPLVNAAINLRIF
jgi:hypothetical protein